MRRFVASLLAVGVLAAACSTPDEQEPPVLQGVQFFLNTPNVASRQADEYAAAGRAEDAAAIRRIADSPTADWYTADEADLESRATKLVTDARAAGRMPVITVYHLPNRDCGLYSAGGAADGAAYRAWIRRLAGALGDAPVLIVLEPDAVPQALEGCAGVVPAERYALLADAVSTFAENAQARIYLDAGNASWVTDHAALADALRRSGIDRSHGFALNVSNFETTEDSIGYGTRLSAALGGDHFVIDTSRNGNGPSGASGDGRWCNPPGRALGAAPTTDTGNPLVDALLWVKRPGESDGDCGNGAPAAGVWYPEYALGLAGR